MGAVQEFLTDGPLATASKYGIRTDGLMNMVKLLRQTAIAI